jgi:hypothetical protein
MSTVQRVNFEPVSDINPIHRRDFPLSDPTLSNPLNADALVDGEYMTLDNNVGNTFGKLIRAISITGDEGTAATVLSFPLFAERGRYDVQAIADRKMPVLYLGQYEFNTRIFNIAANINGKGNAAIATLLQPVKVAHIILGGKHLSGLVGAAFADNTPIVGYVTRLPSGNGQQLRFISGWAVANGAA